MNFKRIVETSYALYRDRADLPFHISFILRGSRVLAIGINAAQTHPLNIRNLKLGREGQPVPHKFICSELAASLKLRNLTNIPARKCSLVNLRINRNGHLALAKPCGSCQSLIRFLGFREVIWTDEAGRFVVDS